LESSLHYFLPSYAQHRFWQGHVKVIGYFEFSIEQTPATTAAGAGQPHELGSGLSCSCNDDFLPLLLLDFLVSFECSDFAYCTSTCSFEVWSLGMVGSASLTRTVKSKAQGG
jgi:hypothetical protein